MNAPPLDGPPVPAPDVSRRPSRITLPGPLALAHPFPSLLDALATAVLATLAGASPERASLLGVGMLALQMAIGAVNDLADEEADRTAKPWKPLAAGRAGRRFTFGLALAAIAAGEGISLSFGPAVAAVASAGLLAGLAYDLRLKRTLWSWVPFGVGLPLLPAYAWLGATGRLPDGYAWLLGLGLMAGLGLALANGLPDLEGDRATGRLGVAARLGRQDATRLMAAVQLACLVCAWASAVALYGRSLSLGAARLAILVGGALPVPARPDAARVPLPPSIVGQPWPLLWLTAGSLVVALGLLASARETSARREMGWELQAVGIALLAAGWLAGATR